MEHLIRSLGKGTDDTVSTVHLLISNLLGPHQQQTCKEQLRTNLDNCKTDLFSVNMWEQ